MAMFTKEPTVARSLYEMALERLAAAEGRLADMVPRQMYDDAVTDRRRWEKRYQKVVQAMTDMKRHELGMIPRDFDASKASAMNTLGPKTQLAIDTFADGSPELRTLLISKAVLFWAEARSETENLDEVDEHVAGLIENGDS